MNQAPSLIGIVMQLNGPSSERIEDLSTTIGSIVRPNKLSDCSARVDKTNQEAIVNESFIVKVRVTMLENSPSSPATGAGFRNPRENPH